MLFPSKGKCQKKFRSCFSSLERYLDTLSKCLNQGEVKSLWTLVKNEIAESEEINEDIGTQFINYFEETYLCKENINWFIGASHPGFCNTNNFLEGHHRFLKKEVFEQKILDMRNFLFYYIFITF